MQQERYAGQNHVCPKSIHLEHRHASNYDPCSVKDVPNFKPWKAIIFQCPIKRLKDWIGTAVFFVAATTTMAAPATSRQEKPRIWDQKVDKKNENRQDNSDDAPTIHQGKSCIQHQSTTTSKIEHLATRCHDRSKQPNEYHLDTSIPNRLFGACISRNTTVPDIKHADHHKRYQHR